MQGWYRKGCQKKRIRENKKVERKIMMEKFEIFLYLVAVLSVLLIAALFVSMFVLTKFDWMIALLSAAVLLYSLLVNKINPYTSFIVLTVIFTVLVYLLVITLGTKVTPSLNENISRYGSAGCLVITFALELCSSYKKMKKISNKKIESLTKKNK